MTLFSKPQQAVHGSNSVISSSIRPRVCVRRYAQVEMLASLSQTSLIRNPYSLTRDFDRIKHA
jgi:hypothetical protein